MEHIEIAFMCELKRTRKPLLIQGNAHLEVDVEQPQQLAG